MSKEYVVIGPMAAAYAVSFTYIGGPTNPELVIASLLLLAACAYRLCRITGGDEFGWGPVHYVLLAYVGLLILLVYTSTLTENSSHFAWVFATFVMVTFLSADLSDKNWKLLAGLFALTGAASALWGLGEFVVSRTQSNGPIIDPNTWAAINNLFFFTCLALYLTASKRYRYVVLAGLFVFSAAVFAAFSRAGLLVFFAALVFSLVIGIRAEKIRTRLLPVMVVVAISFTLVHSLAGGWEEARQGRETGFSLDTGGWQSRVLQWQGAIEIYKDYPLFGSGLGTFKAHYPTVRTIEDLGTAGNFAHNDYVQMLSEGGPLLVLFVGAFVSLLVYGLIVQSFRLAWRQSEDVEPFLLIIAMGTALVHALMNFPLYQIQIQMMLGLLFARYIGLTGLIRWRRTTIRSPRLTRGAIVFGSIVIGAMPVLDAVSTDLVLNHKRIPIVSRIGDNFYTYRDTILFLRSVRSDNWMNRHAMSTIYRQTFDEQDDPAVRRGLAIAAAIECQEAIRLNPFILGIRSYCAEFLAQNSWLQDVEGIDVTAEGLLRDGVEIAPVDIESYLELADFLKSVGREQEAYRILVDEALPYINLKHGNYHEKRYELSLRVLRGARARNDESALERLMGLL